MNAKLKGYHVNITDEVTMQLLLMKRTRHTRFTTPVIFPSGLYTVVVTALTDKGVGGSSTIKGFTVLNKSSEIITCCGCVSFAHF